MFEVGFTEIVLIMGIALLVLGPEKLPGLARTVGRWTGRARSMARQLRMQLEQEVTLEELARTSRSGQTPHKPEPNKAPGSPEGAPAETTSAHDESAPVHADHSSPEHESIVQPDEALEKTSTQ